MEEKLRNRTKKLNVVKYPWTYIINHGMLPECMEPFFDDLTIEEAETLLRDSDIEPWLKELTRAVLNEFRGNIESAVNILKSIDEKNFYVLYNKLRVYTVVGDFERAEESERELKEMDLDRRQRCLLQNGIGTRLWKKSQFKEALNSFTAVLETALELGDKNLEGIGYNNIATALIDTGDYQQARELLTKALEADSATKNERGIAICELNLGECCRVMGDFESAKEFFDECIKVTEALDEYEKTRLRADCYWNLGRIYVQEHDFEKAHENFERALALAEKTKDEQLTVRIYLALGDLAVEEKKLYDAQAHMRSAYERAKAINSKKYEAESYALRGRIEEIERKYPEALQSYGLAAFLFRQIDDKYNMARMEEAAGSIYLIQGNKERAIEYLRKAKAKYAALSYRDFIAIDEKIKKAQI